MPEFRDVSAGIIKAISFQTSCWKRNNLQITCKLQRGQAFLDLWCRKANRTDSKSKMNSFYDSDVVCETKGAEQASTMGKTKRKLIFVSTKRRQMSGPAVSNITHIDRKQAISNGAHHPIQALQTPSYSWITCGDLYSRLCHGFLHKSCQQMSASDGWRVVL